MQLTPATAQYIAQKSGGTAFRSPTSARRRSTSPTALYLRYLIDATARRVLALAAYNAGEGNVDTWIAGRARGRGAGHRRDPFGETRATSPVLARAAGLPLVVPLELGLG